MEEYKKEEGHWKKKRKSNENYYLIEACSRENQIRRYESLCE
jgi:hypothetical protein